MDRAALLSLISLIPDRAPRGQSGSPFTGAGAGRAELLAPFLGWLGPLNPISKEEQQLLGVRMGAGRGLIEGEAAGEEPDPAFERAGIAGEADDASTSLPEAGTPIAA